MNSLNPHNNQFDLTFKKIVNMHKSLGLTLIHLSFSTVQFIGAFIVLFLTRKSVDSGSLKMIVFIYAILNILLVLIFVIRIMYMKNIFERPPLIFYKLVLYELSCKAAKFMILSLGDYITVYEKILKSESKALFFTYIFIATFDIATTSLSFFSYFFYLLFSLAFVRTMESELILITEVNISKYEGCAICLEDYEVNQEILELACKHNFHKNCINQWLDINKNCPACKKDLWLECIIYENSKVKV